LILVVVLLCGCGAKKKVLVPPELPEALWHTVQVTNTMLQVEADDNEFNVSCQMQAVRDSLLVVSIMPMLNMELLRIEATPTEAILIDKMHRKYAKLDLSEAKDWIVPAFRWEDLQALVSGERTMPEADKMTLEYMYRGEIIRLTVTYGTIAYDAPVHVRHLSLDKYQKVDIKEIL